MTTDTGALFRTAEQPEPQPARHAGGRKPNLRPCRECGGLLSVAEGQPFPPHNQYLMTKDGIREGDEPCDGADLRVPTATSKEN